MNYSQYFEFYFCLFNILITYVTSSFKVNYFEQTKDLFYINCLYDDNGDLYFEYWGVNDSQRYLIGIKLSTGEDIFFGNSKIKELSASQSQYHASIIINNNNELNLFSINVDQNYLDQHVNRLLAGV